MSDEETACASPPRSSTPPVIGRRYGVAPAKVIGWIESGELSALNLAGPDCTRPRYHVTEAALEQFEASRRVVPDGGPSAIRRLRRKSAGATKDYFPN